MFTAKWDTRFLKLAQEISTWSKDQSTKVGCVITSRDRVILSTGYNGLSAGLNDDVEAHPERHDRTKEKYDWWVHGEENAVCNAALNGVSLKDSVCYVTLFPCMRCARLLQRAGIRAVIYDQNKTDLYKSTGRLDVELATNLFKETGIYVLGYPLPPQNTA